MEARPQMMIACTECKQVKWTQYCAKIVIIKLKWIVSGAGGVHFRAEWLSAEFGWSILIESWPAGNDWSTSAPGWRKLNGRPHFKWTSKKFSKRIGIVLIEDICSKTFEIWTYTRIHIHIHSLVKDGNWFQTWQQCIATHSHKVLVQYSIRICPFSAKKKLFRCPM